MFPLEIKKTIIDGVFDFIEHVDSGRGVSYTGYTGCDTFKVDISDLITGKMEVVSPGYKGEVNNEGLES